MTSNYFQQYILQIYNIIQSDGALQLKCIRIFFEFKLSYTRTYRNIFHAIINISTNHCITQTTHQKTQSHKQHHNPRKKRGEIDTPGI